MWHHVRMGDFLASGYHSLVSPPSNLDAANSLASPSNSDLDQPCRTTHQTRNRRAFGLLIAAAPRPPQALTPNGSKREHQLEADIHRLQHALAAVHQAAATGRMRHEPTTSRRITRSGPNRRLTKRAQQQMTCTPSASMTSDGP